MDPITAFQITSMLEGAVLRGTGSAIRVLNRPLAGKTGTTNEYRSAWFVGFSPQVVAGVFVGFDDNRSLGNGETGATAAVPIFIDFMRVALKDKPPLPFVPPKTARFGMVNGVREAFRPGAEPKAAPTLPTGPIPYNQLNSAPVEAAPVVEAPPAVVRQPDIIGNLY